ncbi:MAG: hypothetical protein J6V70_04210 [Kiritimatiellae bacterium]|nr:hypothetical protein [Kiritimatiellia bacterium]
MAQDKLIFIGDKYIDGKFEIITKPDEVGNVLADLTEVTTAFSNRVRKKLQTRSLSEAMEVIVHHQATSIQTLHLQDSKPNFCTDVNTPVKHTPLNIFIFAIYINIFTLIIRYSLLVIH